MAQRTYKIEEGSLHEKFQASRAKIQMFAGGFGNGKTTAAVIKAINLAKDYPGSNGLVARSTYPKLTNTIRKEFVAWIPPSWIERNVDSKQNLIQLKNGSVINFSHIAQGGKTTESSTSNLLSATYDWIVVDQIEDPEITEKDFNDLLGRLRGQTTYNGDDDTMPTSGPRWFIIMCNPTRNWVYRKLVKPLQDYMVGLHNPELIRDPTGKPLMELFEGSTYANAANLPEDFITTQEAAYKGQMRERFLLGKWGAYEGLIYPQYDNTKHLINHDMMMKYYEELTIRGYTVNLVEAYDHGIASPACYGFGFIDPYGNVCLLDGFYKKEQTIHQLAKEIIAIRRKYGFVCDIDDRHTILADPAIFRRAQGTSKTVGVPVSTLFREEGVKMSRANNDILSGIAKVQTYLFVDEFRANPFTNLYNSPRLFISTNCDWVDREITDYYWKRDNSGEYEDVPNDKNDHAMDMLKYLLTNRPRIATLNIVRPPVPAKYLSWRETEQQQQDHRKHRYGRH
jgi:phage terminase large subunit